MQTSTTVRSDPAPTNGATAPLFSGTLTDLLDLKPPELERLYAAATTPRLDALRGDLKGRMLAWDKAPARVNQLLLALARSSRFPWRGKSFTPLGADAGEGINRVVSDRLRLFKFHTAIAPSLGGPFDALQLDYDLPGNPGVIRMIKDEVRELRPGLWLGQAYLVRGAKPRLVLYFGLSSD